MNKKGSYGSRPVSLGNVEELVFDIGILKVRHSWRMLQESTHSITRKGSNFEQEYPIT